MYVLKAAFEICWVGDGCGAMSVPAQQRYKVAANVPVLVPGGDTLTTGNISAACATIAANGATLLNNNLTQIQGFSTGGG